MTFLRVAGVAALLAALSVACGSSPSATSAGTACQAVGGACLLGGAICATPATSSAQDCNPTQNPGAAFCCLATVDGGFNVDGAATDAGSDAGSDAADATGRPCASDSDCGTGYGCGYLYTAGCSASPACAKLQFGTCKAKEMCACDGTSTTACALAGGYAPKPVAYVGACVDGGPDASSDAAGE